MDAIFRKIDVCTEYKKILVFLHPSYLSKDDRYQWPAIWSAITRKRNPPKENSPKTIQRINSSLFHSASSKDDEMWRKWCIASPVNASLIHTKFPSQQLLWLRISFAQSSHIANHGKLSFAAEGYTISRYQIQWAIRVIVAVAENAVIVCILQCKIWEKTRARASLICKIDLCRAMISRILDDSSFKTVEIDNNYSHNSREQNSIRRTKLTFPFREKARGRLNLLALVVNYTNRPNVSFMMYFCSMTFRKYFWNNQVMCSDRQSRMLETCSV